MIPHYQSPWQDGIGTVISHTLPDGNEHPIAFALCTLSSSELPSSAGYYFTQKGDGHLNKLTHLLHFIKGGRSSPLKGVAYSGVPVLLFPEGGKAHLTGVTLRPSWCDQGEEPSKKSCLEIED